MMSDFDISTVFAQPLVGMICVDVRCDRRLAPRWFETPLEDEVKSTSRINRLALAHYTEGRESH